MPAPPHSLHRLLSRWCWQMLAPPRSLNLFILRWCGQMLAPPHSLHWLLMRWCSQMLETLLPPGNLCRIDQLIDPEFVLDAIDKMPEMRSFARTVDLTSACRFLDQLSVGSPAEYARHLLPEACPGHGSLSTFGEFGGSSFGHVQSSNGGFGGGGFGGGQSSNGGFGGGGGGGASTFRFEGFSPVSLHP